MNESILCGNRRALAINPISQAEKLTAELYFQNRLTWSQAAYIQAALEAFKPTAQQVELFGTEPAAYFSSPIS